MLYRKVVSSEEQITMLNQRIALYEKIFSNANIGFIRHKKDGTILEVNAGLEHLFGDTAANVVGRNLIEFIAPDSRTQAKKQRGDADSLKSFDFRIITKTGEIKWGMLSSRTIELANGKGLQAMVVDITERKKAEEQLRLEHEKREYMINSITDGYFEVDLAGNFVDYNMAMSSIIGYSFEEMKGMNNRAFMDEENQKKVFSAFNEVYRSRKAMSVFDWQVIRKDGTIRYIETSIALRTDIDGNPIGFYGFVRDITERKNAETLLGIQRDLAMSLISKDDVIESMYCIVDAALNIKDIDCGGIYLRNADGSLDLIAHRGLSDEFVNEKKHFAPDAPQALFIQKGDVLYRTHEESLPENIHAIGVIPVSYNGEVRLVLNAASHTTYEILPSARTVLEAIARQGIEVLRREQEKKEKRSILQELAQASLEREHRKNHDYLTELPNKEFFEKELQQEIDLSEKKQIHDTIAVVSLTIDNFKRINDKYGAQIEDKFIKHIADRLNSRIRLRRDDKVARAEGNKFYIRFSHLTKPEDLLYVLQEIKKLFNDDMILTEEGISARFTVSMGVSMNQNGDVHYQYAKEMIHDSDIALSYDKQDKKSKRESTYTFYKQETEEKLLHIYQAALDLERAIAHKELFISVQPLFKLPRFRLFGKIVVYAVEVLVRWKTPDGTIIMPDEFIPFAEQKGYIREIDEYVLLETIRLDKEWEAKGYPPIQFNINLLPLELSDPLFIERIDRHIVDDNQRDRSRYLFEITEGGIEEDEDEILKRLQHLNSLGYDIAIDDYGKGYSNIDRYDSYPGSIVKIDKKYIMNLPKKRGAIESIKTLVRFSEQKKRMLAEGIENNAILNQVIKMGIPLGQGWGLGKPMTPEEFETLYFKKEK